MSGSKTTPIRRQYLQIKKQYPDAIVLFRLGDFYETFDDDAKVLSQVCDVVLTSRPVGKGQRVPLAGVPYHAVEGYIAKLISAGYKVAIVEQVGDQPVRGLMPREVTRVVTPGTVVEPTLLEEKRNNYLAALVMDGERAGLAYVDITTGEFATTQLADEDVRTLVTQELERLQPRECLVPEEGPEAGLVTSAFVTPYARWHFDPDTARRALLEHFHTASLAGFGCEGKPLAVQAAGAIVQYLQDTQKTALAQLISLRTYSTSEFMALDTATRRNLELTQTIRSGEKEGSLLGVLDATVTAMGGRLLRRWLNQPLLDIDKLNARLDAVEAFYRDTAARAEVRALLRGLPDLERLTNRVVQGIARPRDLVGIRRCLEVVPRVREVLTREAREARKTRNADAKEHAKGLQGAGNAEREGSYQPKELEELTRELEELPELRELLTAAITDDPPVTLSKGGVIRPGFSAELDGVLIAVREAKEWIASLERQERERTGIKTLKVGYNKVFGYYIEVTKANLEAVPPEYIRKQTLVNAERFITPELKEYEARILGAEERIQEIEARLFRQVCGQVAAAAERLLGTARALARLDVYAALGEVAMRNRYVRPQLTEEDVIEIKGGRHPVVELTMREEPFVPNDVRLNSEERILIITGPNMSGKCVRGDTLVFTDQGVLPIVELMPPGAPEDHFTPLHVQVQSRLGRTVTSHFFNGGRQRTVRIRTQLGYELEGTPEHRVWVRHANEHEGWKQLEEIRPGDYVAIHPGPDLWGRQVEIRLPEDFDSSVKGSVRYRLPRELTPDLAYLMGLLVGDGTLTYRNAVNLSTGDDFIRNEFYRIVWEQFGYRARTKGNKTDHYISSKQIRRFFECLGLGYDQAQTKHVPDSILRAPREIVRAFLQGLFDADGYADTRYGNVSLASASLRLIREVQMLLLNFGVISSIKVKKTTKLPSYILLISGIDALHFYNRIGFRLPRKQARSALVSDKRMPEEIQRHGYFYDRVIAVEKGEAEVYDLSVPGAHSFVANGFINHNSTYLRQVALIVLMAQIGSFVPADEARIGIVDRIFTRVGAQDELAAGRSTFMVEMVETANILHHATPRSLLILDEIGRGTSTYDGISIAWAVVEYIHNHPHLRAKTLFATHYHELTALAEILPRVRNYNVAVTEEGDQVVFLHKIVPGGADKSYGIHVAQLAGLPRPVVHRAEEILEQLEQESARAPVGRGQPVIRGQQLPLFVTTDPVIEELKKLDINTMTPLEALNKLYELQQRVMRK